MECPKDFPSRWQLQPIDHRCYDPGSSLRKRNDLQGKDGSTSSLRNLAKASTGANAEDNVSRTGVSGSKGELMTTAAEVGTEDTGSDGYR